MVQVQPTLAPICDPQIRTLQDARCDKIREKDKIWSDDKTALSYRANQSEVVSVMNTPVSRSFGNHDNEKNTVERDMF